MEAVLQLARRVLDRGVGARGELEAYVEHRTVTTLQAGTSGSLRYVGRADTCGVGVRAVLGDHVGYASTTDLSDDGLTAVVANARANAQVGDPDPAGATLPGPASAEPLDGLRSPALTGLALDAKLSFPCELAKRTTSLDDRVRRIDTAEWRDEHRRVAVASTRGVEAAYETAFAELWCDALGEDENGQVSDYGYWWGRDPERLNLEHVAREAVTRTVRLLGPALPPPPLDTVILDPAVTAVLLDMIGRAMTGGALGNRRSPFATPSEDPVAADIVRLVDDGRCVGAPAAAPVDDEGVPRGQTSLIADGVRTGALHSVATAASFGAASTGNARRTNHKSFPRAAATTLRLEPSPGVPEWPEDAVYLQQLSGSVSGISAVTGRASLGGVGFMVRGREPAERLSTVPVATTLQRLLREVVVVGTDARAVPDRAVLAPSVVWRPGSAPQL